MRVHTDGIPILNATRKGDQLVTEPCPFCRPSDRRRRELVHCHGTGNVAPRRLTHRERHCAEKRTVEVDGRVVSNEGGYYLYWDGSEEPGTASMLKWEQALRAMLLDFRQRNPGDQRTDRELLESLMGHFHESGIVKKDANGKWILPGIEGSFPLIN